MSADVSLVHAHLVSQHWPMAVPMHFPVPVPSCDLLLSSYEVCALCVNDLLLSSYEVCALCVNDLFHHSIMELCKKHMGLKVKIKWVPGHKGVEGNEMADEQAKKAITEGSRTMDELPKLLRKKCDDTSFQ